MKKIIYNYKKLSMTIQNLYEPCIILIGNLENVGEQLNMSLNFFTGAAEGEGLPGLKPYHFCAFFFFLEWRVYWLDFFKDLPFMLFFWKIALPLFKVLRGPC